MDIFLGIDGGGTKTRVVAADSQAKIIGTGISGPTNLTATELGAASMNLKEAIRQALQPMGDQKYQVIKAVMGLAGVDSGEESLQAAQVFKHTFSSYQISNFEIFNDTVIALESGTDAQDAIVLIAGTGSNCWGRRADGQTHRTSGMDYLLADQGSGYELGRRCLRQAVKSFDGRAAPTILEQKVCQHFNISSIAQLKPKVYDPPLTKTQVAAVAKLVFDAHQQGDVMAQELLDDVIDSLELMAKTVITKLHIETHQIELVVAGSIVIYPYIFTEFNRRLTTQFRHVSIVQPKVSPVMGALKMAMELSIDRLPDLQELDHGR